MHQGWMDVWMDGWMFMQFTQGCGLADHKESSATNYFRQELLPLCWAEI